MKSLSPKACKLLFLLSLIVLGHQIHPVLFPPKQEVVEAPEKIAPEVIPEEVALKPEPVLPKVAPEVIPKAVAKLTPKAVIPSPLPEKQEPLEAESILDTASMILVGRTATSSIELQKDGDLLEHASYYGEWDKYRSMLTRSLVTEFGEIRLDHSDRRYDKVWDEERYYTATLRWKVLGGFPYEVLEVTKSKGESAELMKWILTNNQAMEELLLTLHVNDDREKVFEFLSRVWKNEKVVLPKSNKEVANNKKEENEEEKVDPAESLALNEKYFNLALACAVVFDEELAYKNDPALSETSEGESANVNGLMRYHWYRNKNEKGLLEGDIHRASAKDLTFVVCSPVSTVELEWALKKYRSSSRKKFGQAYSDVEYLMERAVNGLNPYKEYTLPEILKEGGICGDQSYFCVNVARSAGIPAFTLSGVTNSGAHAWAAVKIKDDEWSTEIGRIGGVSKGQGRDPQTRKRISEQDVWMWSTRKFQTRSNVVQVFRHLWMSDFFVSVLNKAEYSESTQIANNLGKEFPITWQRVYELMLRDPTLTETPELPETLARWQKFLKALVREFKDNPRMGSIAIEIEDKHIFPYGDIKDLRRDLARDRRRKAKDAAEQADLVAASIKRESELLLKKDEDTALVEIHQLYSRALREYGGSITGFDDMSQYYFSVMKQDREMAMKAVRTIESAFNRVLDSGSDDWFRIKTEVGLQRKIAKMYREVGDDRKADIMDKKLDRIMKNAKRKAL